MRKAKSRAGIIAMVFAKTANRVVSTIPTHAGKCLKLGNAAEAPIVRTNTSTCTRQPPMLRRLQDNAATLHRGSPKARVEAKARTSNPRAHSEVAGPSRRDATDHVDDSVHQALPLDPRGKGGALLGHDSAQRMPC